MKFALIASVVFASIGASEQLQLLPVMSEPFRLVTWGLALLALGGVLGPRVGRFRPRPR